MGKFRLSRAAKRDVSDIVEYIALDNIDSALGIEDQLVQTFRRLADNPLIGRERSDLIHGSRSFPVGAYLVIYRVWAGEVAIVRVVHGSRDLESLFGED